MFPIGFGTGRFVDENACYRSVRRALAAGYRYIDTAQQYGNETAVSQAIADSNVHRLDIYLSYNIHSQSLSYGSIHNVVKDALFKSGSGHFDACSVHWPAHEYDPAETFCAFAELQEENLIRKIGVSNFTINLLETALEFAEISFISIEYHPYLQQKELLRFAKSEGIDVVAHTPLAQGRINDDPEILHIARKHEATPAQVSLSWLHSIGLIPVPSGRGQHIDENFESLQLELDHSDRARIDTLDVGERFVDYSFAPWNS